MSDQKDHELQAIDFLRSRTDARDLLKRLIMRSAPDDTSYFVPSTIQEIDLHNAFAALDLVIPIKRELRLSNAGRAKDAFIECRLTALARRVYAEALPSDGPPTL